MTAKKETGGVPDANRKTPPAVLEQPHGGQHTEASTTVKQNFWILEEINRTPLEKAQARPRTKPPGPHAKGTRYKVHKPSKPHRSPKYRDALHIPQWMEMSQEWESITPERFRELRCLVHFMSMRQCAAFLRVDSDTVWRWERGDTKIPFSAYMALRLLTDVRFLPHQVADWKGWRIINAGPDIGKLYDAEKTGALISPVEIRQIPWIKGERDAWKQRAGKAEGRATELEAENVRLRQLIQQQGITRELRDMQERLAAILDGVETAELIAFPEQAKKGRAA